MNAVPAPAPRQHLLGAVSLVGASACFQAGAAVAVPAFAVLGTAHTSALRFLIAAVLMLVAVRPSLRRSVREWGAVAVLGVAVAVMTMSSYEALQRIPQGTATTLEFLGPLAVAVAASRTRRQVFAAALAIAGVALIAGPSLHISAAGVGFGVLTAAAFAGYILLQNRAGQAGQGLSALALSLAVAAVLTLPLSIPATTDLTGAAAVRVLFSGVVGVGVAYALDTIGIKRVGPRQAGVLLSLDPAVGALSGLVLLGQHLTVIAVVGIGVVVTAGVVSSLTETKPPADG